MLQDVAVGREAERAEDDQDGQVGADVGDRRADGLRVGSQATGSPRSAARPRGVLPTKHLNTPMLVPGCAGHATNMLAWKGDAGSGQERTRPGHRGMQHARHLRMRCALGMLPGSVRDEQAHNQARPAREAAHLPGLGARAAEHLDRHAARAARAALHHAAALAHVRVLAGLRLQATSPATSSPPRR